ncbi:MAG: Na+-dependent transporter [Pseudomonadota bacterium]
MGDIASLLIISDAVVSASLIALILAVGLDATADDVLYVLRRPKLLFVGVLSVNVIMPVAAGLVIALYPLTPIVKTGIVLMALSAVPPILPGEELKAGATKAYAYGLYTALALLTVIVVPAWVAVVGWIYDVQASVPLATVAGKVGWQVLLPLTIGLALRRLAPKLAAGATPWVSKFSMTLLFVGEIPVFINSWPMMMALIGDGTVLVMVAISAIGLLAGHILGGRDLGERGALALASATRHPGIATMIASANAADEQVSAVILLFLLAGMLTAEPYKRLLKRRMRLAPTSPGMPGVT